MKTITLSLTFFVFISINTFAQLNYEGIVDTKYKTVQLENGQFKYHKYNQESQELLIFNLDNSLWKTVKLPLPDRHILDEVKYVSQSTFNKDELIEVAYSCIVYSHNSEYEDPNQPFVFIEFTFNIINELGEHILKVENSNEMKIIDSNGKKKLLVFKHIGAGIESFDQTVIYSLP